MFCICKEDDIPKRPKKSTVDEPQAQQQHRRLSKHADRVATAGDEIDAIVSAALDDDDNDNDDDAADRNNDDDDDSSVDDDALLRRDDAVKRLSLAGSDRYEC